MPLDAYKNFAAATLAAGINSSATSLSVASGQGARFPAAPFNATIYNATDYADAADAYHAGHAEIVRVTAISTDTLTITRAQESTTAVNLNTGGKTYRIVAGLSAKMPGETLPVDSELTAKVGKLGVGATPGSSGMDTSTLVHTRRTDVTGPGVRLVTHHVYEGAFPNDVVSTPGLFDVINTGSATGGAGHLLGVIGRAQDTASGARPMYGVEGKVIVKGTSDANAAVWGIADYDGASHTGRMRTVFSGFAEIFNGSLSSPVNEGGVVIFHALNGTGGDPTQRFALLGEALMKIRTGGTTYIQMEHDGTDGKIAVNTGALRLYAPGNFVVLQDAYGLVPYAEGSSLGINGFRWAGAFTSMNANIASLNEAAAPATPASGTVALYAKTDGRLYSKDDTGAESALGGATPVVIQIAASDTSTAITAGTGKVTFRMPHAMTLTAVRASVNTAPTGSTIVIDINEEGTSILSTKLSIDASEKTSTTAATAAVISDATLADDAEITIDFDQVGSTVAGKGVVVTLIGTR